MKPILLDLWGLTLFAYPLFMGLAWGMGYYGTLNQLEKRNVSVEGYKTLFWGVFISSWVGAKVFFLMNSSQGNLQTYAANSNFWLGGGFVFYGGFLFGLTFIVIYCLLLKKFDISHLYLSLPSFSFAHAIGRTGCFLAGCCYGTQCDLPWAIDLHNKMRHPVQLYEAIALVILGLWLRKLIKSGSGLWFVLNTYVASYALLRFALEFFRGDKIRGAAIFGLSSSQGISLAVLISLILFNLYRNRQTS